MANAGEKKGLPLCVLLLLLRIWNELGLGAFPNTDQESESDDVGISYEQYCCIGIKERLKAVVVCRVCNIKIYIMRKCERIGRIHYNLKSN